MLIIREHLIWEILLDGEVEETGDLGGEGAIHVVDKGIEEAGGSLEGVDVIVGNGSRDEGGVTLAEEDLVTSATYTDLTIASDAHRDDEAVVLQEVAMEGSGQLHDTDIEIGGVHDMNGLVLGFLILREIVFLDMVVEGLGSQVGMELAGLAIQAWTVIIIDAIGDVGGLLHLGQHNATTDGMDTTGREIEDIAGLHLMVGQDLSDGAIGDSAVILVRGNLLLKAGIEVTALVGLDDVPHLGLAFLTVFTHGHLIIGVDLNAEVLLGINELHQEGQLTAVCLVGQLAQDFIGVFADDLIQRLACPGSITDDAGAGGHHAHLPALANRVNGGGQALVGAEVVATPYHLTEVGGEKQWV